MEWAAAIGSALAILLLVLKYAFREKSPTTQAIGVRQDAEDKVDRATDAAETGDVDYLDRRSGDLVADLDSIRRMRDKKNKTPG